MKNSIIDLNNYLYEQIERLNDDDLDGDELEKALRRSEGIVRISETIIENNKIALAAMKHMNEMGYDAPTSVKNMLGTGNGK